MYKKTNLLNIKYTHEWREKRKVTRRSRHLRTVKNTGSVGVVDVSPVIYCSRVIY